MSGRGKKIVVAMSGGVDSSVAAALLLREGYEVLGAFMRLGSPAGVGGEMQNDECRVQNGPHPNPLPVYRERGEEQGVRDTSGKNKQGCCSVLDAADARRVAGMLGIPFYVLNFQDDFDRVINYFVSEYNRGRTPNPCVRCNDWLKFGKLAQYAEAVGADFVASGHYARIGVDPVTGEKALMRGVDHKKDQSYVLFGMSRWAMEHTLLPIGGYEKHEVRKIAEELKLPVFNKPDSQEICFVPNQDYAELVRRRSPESFHEGQLVGTDGKVVGTHNGHQHFTIGQRKGVGVAFGRPIYVVDIDPRHNRVTLGDKEDLLRSTLMASQINILSSRLSPNSGPVRCSAKIRYNHLPQAAVVEVMEGMQNDECRMQNSPHPNPLPEYRERGQEGEMRLRVTFDEPQAAITPGQAVVLYDGDVLLGGGWID